MGEKFKSIKAVEAALASNEQRLLEAREKISELTSEKLEREKRIQQLELKQKENLGKIVRTEAQM